MVVLIISLPIALAEELNLQIDANGNLVTGDSFYREYNELNQLIRIREGNISTGPILEEFIWHPLEERILVKDVFSNGVRNYSIYYVNQNYILIENSSGNYSEKYVYQDGQLVAFVDTDGNKRFVHSDHLGSVSLITDINGNVVEESLYSPHGEILAGGIASRFDFTGKEYNPTIDEYDLGIRMYKPRWNILLQADPLFINDAAYGMPVRVKFSEFVFNSQHLNRYMYVIGNPYRYVDVTGYFRSDVFWKGGIIPTALGGASVVAGAYTLNPVAIYLGITSIGVGVSGIIIGSLTDKSDDRTAEAFFTAQKIGQSGGISALPTGVALTAGASTETAANIGLASSGIVQIGSSAPTAFSGGTNTFSRIEASISTISGISQTVSGTNAIYNANSYKGSYSPCLCSSQNTYTSSFQNNNIATKPKANSLIDSIKKTINKVKESIKKFFRRRR